MGTQGWGWGGSVYVQMRMHMHGAHHASLGNTPARQEAFEATSCAQATHASRSRSQGTTSCADPLQVAPWFRRLFPYSRWGAELNVRITPAFFAWLVCRWLGRLNGVASCAAELLPLVMSTGVVW